MSLCLPSTEVGLAMWYQFLGRGREMCSLLRLIVMPSESYAISRQGSWFTLYNSSPEEPFTTECTPGHGAPTNLRIPQNL